MQSINLDELTRGGEVRNLSGHPRGVAARTKFALDALDRSAEVIVVKVPDYLYALTPSFFQGMFAESVRAAGSRDKFLQRYKFDAPTVVLRQIESGIESSLMKRQSIFTS